MSVNCVRCAKNRRTGQDLYCDDCRLEKHIQAHCTHDLTTFIDHPDEPGLKSIELCDGCGMSRHHWEQGESDWMSVDLTKLGTEPE